MEIDNWFKVIYNDKRNDYYELLDNWITCPDILSSIWETNIEIAE